MIKAIVALTVVAAFVSGGMELERMKSRLAEDQILIAGLKKTLCERQEAYENQRILIQELYQAHKTEVDNGLKGLPAGDWDKPVKWGD